MTAFITGIGIYAFVRIIIFGFYTIDQNERAVKTIFGRAERLDGADTLQLPISDLLNSDEKSRYKYPLVHVIGPGLHLKWPWETIYKVNIATETMNMAYDPESPLANHSGTMLEAVTRDQLNIGLKGQIRFRVSEQNLYAYIFGIRNPLFHVMGYFVSILREKIARFQGQAVEVNSVSDAGHLASESVSINDLRKNLRDLNDIMVKECQSSEARYGMVLEASLITAIEPPHEVESALAAINTAYNNVSSEISLAKASADQTIVQSRRAVEIETLRAQAEVEPLVKLAEQLHALKSRGPDALKTFVRNVKLDTFEKARRVILRTGQ